MRVGEKWEIEENQGVTKKGFGYEPHTRKKPPISYPFFKKKIEKCSRGRKLFCGKKTCNTFWKMLMLSILPIFQGFLCKTKGLTSNNIIFMLFH